MNKTKKCNLIQKYLNKLISEEWFAGQVYTFFITSSKVEELPLIYDALKETAVDEIEDHYNKLVNYAKNLGFTVPQNYTDYKKYANEDDVRVFENFKRNKGAIYFLNECIESEERAILSYSEAIETLNKELYGTCVYPSEIIHELIEILYGIYYDEIEHLNTFKFLHAQITAQSMF